MNNPTPSKDVAVPGLLRPPLVLLAAIALGVVLNLIWPFRFIPSALVMAGPVIVFAAVLLFALSLREFRAQGLPCGERNAPPPLSAPVLTDSAAILSMWLSFCSFLDWHFG